jgi:parvulin-like peptidyl-prolyl isomerase
MNRSAKNFRSAASLLALLLLCGATFGCNKKDGAAGETPGAAATAADGTPSPGAAGGSAEGGGQPAAALPGALPPGEGALDPATLPAVVADVNGVKITNEELKRAASAAQSKAARSGQRFALTPDFYKQVLDELVTDRVLQQDAKAAGFTVSGAEIDAQLAMVKSQLPSEDTYEKVLKANNVTEERFKESLGKGIIVQKYVRERLVPAVKVSDEEIQKFYDGNKPQFAVPEQVHVRHILVKVEPGAAPADKEKAKAKAGDLLKRAQGGEDFAQLASANSDDPGSKARGGDIGFLARGKTPPNFEKAAFSLTKPGDLSPVVESQFGYHIMQFIERKQPTVLQLDDQVKKNISRVLQERKALESLRGRVDSLRAGGKIQIFFPA